MTYGVDSSGNDISWFHSSSLSLKLIVRDTNEGKQGAKWLENSRNQGIVFENKLFLQAVFQSNSQCSSRLTGEVNRSYDVEKIFKLNSNGGNSGSKKYIPGYSDAYGDIWLSLRLGSESGARRSVLCWCV